MAELLAARGRDGRLRRRRRARGRLALRSSEGDSLALLGRNGVGKTTLLVTLMGLTRLHRGRAALARRRPRARCRRIGARSAGLGWVPQERFMFPSLTVEEHLTAVARPGPWTLERVYAIFPRLEERRAQLRQPALRRRAADARDRARADGQPAPAAARRADGRPRADHRAGADGRRSASSSSEGGMAVILVEQHAQARAVADAPGDRARARARGPPGTSKALSADQALLDQLIGVGH